MTRPKRLERWPALVLGLPILALLIGPIVALLTALPWTTLATSLTAPAFLDAAGVSLATSSTSLALVVGLGTPLAWWLAAGDGPLRRGLAFLVEWPVVLPPAVLGVGLLQCFGRTTPLGGPLDALGLSPAFTAGAVIIAQTIVATPLYVTIATVAFRKLDPELLLVAQSLGHRPAQCFWRVAVPLSRRALAAGATLAWARALGEFGATLVFAGNLRGRTQTLPLAVYERLESDLDIAIGMAAWMTLATGALLLGGRTLARGRPDGAPPR